MSKLIRIVAIVATSLTALSLLLILVTIPLQPFLAKAVFGYPESMMEGLPYFPVLPVLFCVLRLGCIALLLVCCGKTRGGFWLELVIFLALAAVLPTLSTIATTISTAFLGSQGQVTLVGSSFASHIVSYCLTPANVGQALAYAACGMSIVFKQMSKHVKETI